MNGSSPAGAGAGDEVARAVAILRRGGLVAFPTETVYGLGADASNPTAVRRIFAAKGRPTDHPLIVHLAGVEQLDEWAESIPAFVWQLARRFWPGPLTLILRRRPRVPDEVTGGLDTVGLRVPRHPLALELLRTFAGGLAAPSANRFGRVSPTCAEHVRAELGDRVDLILDGGPCAVGVESTILDVSGAAPAILRPGGVTREQLEEVLGDALVSPASDAPRAPGRLASHYAPQARVELVRRGDMLTRARTAAELGLRVALLVAGSRFVVPAGERWGERIEWVELPEDLAARARELYRALRSIDDARCDLALIELPDEAGLGAAVADRLRKAAGQG
ncbi:MAG: L-threonylcarbamoyladenylate synthase [Pirellulales bacterium]